MRGKTAISLMGVMLAACNGLDVSEIEDQLQADVTATSVVHDSAVHHSVVHYSGDAKFHTESFTRDGLPLFELRSENRPKVGLPTDGYESIGFEGWRKRPKPGIPAVADRRSSFADTTLTWATYWRALDDSIETYSATSGAITITHSFDELVAGTFAFEGVLYCLMSQDPDVFTTDPCDVMNLDLSRPTISVVGSFVATRFEQPDVINQSLVAPPTSN